MTNKDDVDYNMGYDLDPTHIESTKRLKPAKLVSGTFLVHLLGGQIVVGTIERSLHESPYEIKSRLTIKSPYEVFVVPRSQEEDERSTRVVMAKYGTIGGTMMMCGVDQILVGNNAVAIVDVPQDMFDHYIKAMERDRMDIGTVKKDKADVVE